MNPPHRIVLMTRRNRQERSHIHLSNYQLLLILRTAHDFIAQSPSDPLFNKQKAHYNMAKFVLLIFTVSKNIPTHYLRINIFYFLTHKLCNQSF